MEGTHHRVPCGFTYVTMKKTGWKTTSVLETQVHELQGKTIMKGDSPKKNATPVSSGKHPRQSRRADHPTDHLGGFSKSFSQELSDPDQD